MGIMGESAWHSLGRRSWSQAWSAQQEGRLVRTRSFLAWGSAPGIPRPGIPRGDYPATVAEEERSGNEEQHSDSLVGPELYLTVQILRATELPQGLVLWPDDPCVRLTAIVNGRDVSSREEILSLATHNSSMASGKRMERGSSVDTEESKRGHGTTLGHGDVRQGKIKHELELQTSFRDRESDFSSAMPSLRVEVLVSRVVTATGKVELGNLLEVSGLGSSSVCTTLTLAGGGEVMLSVGLCESASLFPGSRTGAPMGQTFENTPPSVPDRGGGPRVHEESEDPVLERFLRGIARCGVVEIRSGSSGDSHDNPPTVHSDDEQVSEGSLAGRSKGGRQDEGRRRDAGAFPNLVEWLSESHPDPPFLRMALEKTDNYSFPLVEAPFFAALLKHSGLVGEAFQAIDMMATRDNGEWRRSKFCWFLVPFLVLCISRPR